MQAKQESSLTSLYQTIHRHRRRDHHGYFKTYDEPSSEKNFFSNYYDHFLNAFYQDEIVHYNHSSNFMTDQDIKVQFVGAVFDVAFVFIEENLKRTFKKAHHAYEYVDQIFLILTPLLLVIYLSSCLFLMVYDLILLTILSFNYIWACCAYSHEQTMSRLENIMLSHAKSFLNSFLILFVFLIIPACILLIWLNFIINPSLLIALACLILAYPLAFVMTSVLMLFTISLIGLLGLIVRPIITYFKQDDVERDPFSGFFRSKEPYDYPENIEKRNAVFHQVFDPLWPSQHDLRNEEHPFQAIVDTYRILIEDTPIYNNLMMSLTEFLCEEIRSREIPERYLSELSSITEKAQTYQFDPSDQDPDLTPILSGERCPLK